MHVHCGTFHTEHCSATRDHQSECHTGEHPSDHLCAELYGHHPSSGTVHQQTEISAGGTEGICGCIHDGIRRGPHGVAGHRRTSDTQRESVAHAICRKMRGKDKGCAGGQNAQTGMFRDGRSSGCPERDGSGLGGGIQQIYRKVELQIVWTENI